MSVVEVMAHRGAAYHEPENTLRAFERALADGSDSIELDVWPSRDGHAVVIHDRDLSRTTDGRGAVDRTAWSELARLDAGSGERIPRLEQVLDLCRGRAWVDVELKTVDAVDVAIAAIDRVGVAEEVVISSFETAALRRARRRRPAIRRALVQGTPGHSPAQRIVEALPHGSLRGHRAWGLVTHHRLCWRGLVRSVQAMGLRCYAWTSLDDDVTAPERIWDRLVRNGIDGICTGRPDALRAFLDGSATPAPL